MVALAESDKFYLGVQDMTITHAGNGKVSVGFLMLCSVGPFPGRFR